MKYRFVIRSVLSVSALALCAAGTVHAQSPSVLQPRGGWSVTKMDQPSNGASAYCALARQYEKDIIFTLGRNLTDEYSLAVDFQKEQLNPDKAYKLTLSPGAGQVRAFDLMPLSPRAMVIRLGWDDSFFKALDSSRALRIGIGEVDYSFNMPDIAAGQKDLQSCVEGLKAAANPQQNAQGADEQATPDETDVLNAEAVTTSGFSARKGAMAESRTAGGTVKTAMSPPPDGMKDTGMKLGDAVPAPSVQTSPIVSRASRAAQDDSAAEIAKLRSANEKLANALEKQRAQLKESYANAPDANTLAEMEEKVRLLEKENERLSKGGAAGTITQQAEANPMPVVAGSDQVKALQQQLKDLAKQNEDLQKQLEIADKVSPTVAPTPASPGEAVQAEALKKQLDLAQSEKLALQGELEALRRKVEDERMAGAGGDEKLEKAVRRYNEAEREIQRLGSLLEQERGARQPGDEDGAKQAQRVALLEKELAKVKGEQAAITTQDKKKAEQAIKDLSAAKAQVQSLEKEKADMGIELSQVKTALASLKQDLGNESQTQQALDDARAKLAEAEKQRKVLSEQNTMYKTELDKTSAALLQAQSQIGGQGDRLAELKKAQQESREYQLKLSALEEEMKKLQATVAMQAYRPDTAAAEEKQLNGAEPAAGYEPPPLQPAAKPVQQAALFSEKDMSGLLQRAGLAPQGGVKSAGQNAYRWDAPNGMKGSAKVVSNAPGFGRLVDQHINDLKAQCKGDFAAIPSSQGTNSANFEVACVTGNGGTSSSIAFFEQQGSFIAVALETVAENMEMAMDARDKIAQVR